MPKENKLDDETEVRTCRNCDKQFTDQENIDAIDDWGFCLLCDKLMGQDNEA